MPSRPPRYKPPGLTKRPPTPSEAARGTAAQRGYGSAWQRFRLSYLAEHPLCVKCQEKGDVTEATVVDHVTPHRGNELLFWAGPFQALCATCHGQKTAAGQ